MARTHFAIITYPRTGSTWLCDALDSHPDVLCHGEVFHPDAVWYSPRHGAEVPMSVAERDANPVAFLESLYRHDGGHASVGLKLMAGHAPGLGAAILRASNIRKIVLRRESRVRVFVSERRAATVNDWKDVKYDGLRVEVDADELVAYAHRYDAYFDWVARSIPDQPALHLTYETLFRDETIAEALAFLGVEADTSLVRPHPEPQSRDGLRDAIANFDELLERLAGTSLAAELIAA